MTSYYANRRSQPSGDHEVHTSKCRYFPKNAQYLGDYTASQPAIAEAKRYFPKANGCATCCPEDNTD
jgi:hypothetical protein